MAESRPMPASSDWQALNDTLSAWEPEFEALDLSDQGRLYEPDGTLYAISLNDLTEIRTDRRRQTLERGDLVVVPRSVAVEVDPAGDFLGLRVAGTPPYHFRERFIQVHGFEHFSGVDLDDDARHRVGYRAVSLRDGQPLEIPLPASSRALLVVLEGEVGWNDRGAQFTGGIALSEETERVVLAGTGRVGVFLLGTSESHHARRLVLFKTGPQPISPEPSPVVDF